MLYLFLVDSGTMVQLEIDVALDTVANLKGVIGRTCRIPPDKQVLLISGGESLDNEEKVCKYNAGTDTNPIFLFNLANIENANSAPGGGGAESDDASHGGFELILDPV